MLTELLNDGTDTLDFSPLASTVPVTVYLHIDSTLATHTKRTVKTATGQGANFENAIGGAGKDTIFGNAADNRIDGGSGDDILFGQNGNDTLIGGTGGDLLTGNIGNDTFAFAAAAMMELDYVFEEPSEGSDWLDFSALTVGVSVNLANVAVANHENRAVRLLAIGSPATNIENVIGGSGADTLAGGTGAGPEPGDMITGDADDFWDEATSFFAAWIDAN